MKAILYTPPKPSDPIKQKTGEGCPEATCSPPPFDPPKGSFQKELEHLINCKSIEGGSDTPDFILAEYLRQCLDAFDMATRRREEWYGRRTIPCDPPSEENIQGEAQPLAK